MKSRTIEENRDFLLKYMPNLDEILESNDVDDFLFEFDCVIQKYGFTNYPSDSPLFGYSPLGSKMQDIYDEVYRENQ